MGIEAYRLIVKFKHIDIVNLVDELTKLNAIVTENCANGDIELEIFKTNGIIELLISTIRTPQNNKHNIIDKNVNISRIDVRNVVLNIRFAKSNSIDLINDILEIFNYLNNIFEIEFVGDVESKKKIDIQNYSDLKIRIINAKKDFEKWFGQLPYPIRCKDVFPTYRKLHPEKITK